MIFSKEFMQNISLSEFQNKYGLSKQVWNLSWMIVKPCDICFKVLFCRYLKISLKHFGESY